MQTPTAALTSLAGDVARAAGRLLLDYQQRDLTVETKSSATDPVSEADRASERLIVGRLLAIRPDDGMVGEEGQADRRGTSGLRWVIDPLDGTVNYLYGIPVFNVSIAVEDDRGGLAGVVYDPNRDELFAAGRGEGAHLGGRELRVTQVTDMSEALIATGFMYGRAAREIQGPAVAELVGIARDVRRCGAAALDLAWTAAGRLDGYYEFGLQRWDRAAGALLVREAGGLTAERTHAFAGQDEVGVIAAGPGLHATLDAWVARHLNSVP